MRAVPASMPERLGAYRLDRLIGKGGMAEVYQASRIGPRGFSKRFALKRMRPDLAHDPVFVELFCSEARMGARLSHPNIVQVIDFGEQAGELFMVMEYVDGLPCSSLSRRLEEVGDALPLGAALYIGRSVLRGLSYVHTLTDERGAPLGLVHRDVSPGNVLIGRMGEVKLSDFGIAKDGGGAQSPGSLHGGSRYMSPEQLSGGPVDARSDLFSVALLLAGLLLGHPQLEGHHGELIDRSRTGEPSWLEGLSGAAPEALVEVVLRALAHEPAQRFRSAAEFERELAAVAVERGLAFGAPDLASLCHRLRALGSRSGLRLARRPSVPASALIAGVRLSVPPHPPPAEGAQSMLPTLPPARHPDSAPYGSLDRVSILPTLPPLRGYGQAERCSLPTLPPGSAASPKLPARCIARRYELEGTAGSRQRASVPALLERIATGRVGPKQRVSIDSGPWVSLDSTELYAQVAARAAFGLCRELPGVPCWRRELHRPDLPLALFGLVRGRRSGVLELECGGRRKRVYLRAGNPVFVSSSDPGELLGARLVREGLLGVAELDRALLLAAGTPGMRLGEALVVMGLVPPELVAERLYEQLVERFVEVGGWAACTASFTEGISPGEEGLEVGASGLELVAHALNEGYDDVEITLLLGPFRNGPLVRRAWLDDLVVLGLTEDQERALVRAPAAMRLDALLADMARDRVAPHDTLRAVFVGLAAGLLFMPGWPEAPRGAALAARSGFGPEEYATSPSAAEWFFGASAQVP